MVRLDHHGFGVRDRPLLLYYWDMRDGPEWSGWWITPDFIGNNEYVLHNQCDPATVSPAALEVGTWRSPNVEQMQLKRSLALGFKDDETGCLRVCGSDATTVLSPDGRMQVDLSKLRFMPVSMNHGKTAYEAQLEEAPAAAAAAAVASAPAGTSAALHVAAGVLLGVVATAGVFVLATRRRA